MQNIRNVELLKLSHAYITLPLETFCCTIVLAKISILPLFYTIISSTVYHTSFEHIPPDSVLFTESTLLEGNNPLLNIQKYRSRRLEVKNKVILYASEIPLLMTGLQ